MIASQNILDALCSSDLTSLLVTWQQVRFQFLIDSIRAVYLGVRPRHDLGPDLLPGATGIAGHAGLERCGWCDRLELSRRFGLRAGVPVRLSAKSVMLMKPLLTRASDGYCRDVRR